MHTPKLVFPSVVLLLLGGGLTSCLPKDTTTETPKTDKEEAELEHAARPVDPPGLPLPENFNIGADGLIQGDTLVLDIAVDVPEGSYVISALSDRDYLGKFQLHWGDSLMVSLGQLTEDPPSRLGWEPWDKVHTPMLFSPTRIRQSWLLPEGADTLKGEVFFVLEPQCVPYALDVQVVRSSGQVTQGLVHPQYPD